MTNFDYALLSALDLEGGYVNNPHDPGGATNKGITQHLYDHYRYAHGLVQQAVSLLSTSEATEIYLLYFWNQYNCGLMPLKLSVAFFDTVINTSPQHAIMLLQVALNVLADGHMGPITQKVMISAEPNTAVNLFIKTLRGFYIGRDTEFMHGWLNRCDRIERYVDTLQVT